MAHSTDRHDVVVVGGRCAGAATARLLAAHGHDVVVVERGDLHGDPLSTHGLARGGVVQLARWGLLDEVLASGAPASREVTFGVEGRETRRPVKDRRVSTCWSPRGVPTSTGSSPTPRSTRVRPSSPARPCAGSCATATVGSSGVSRPDRQRATTVASRRHVVGADGLRSTTGRACSARVWSSPSAPTWRPSTPTSTGALARLRDARGRRAYAGVFPTHDGQAAVWLCRPTRAVAATYVGPGPTAPRRCSTRSPRPPPRSASGSAPGGSSPRCAASSAPPNHVRQAFGPGWALVGDAGYHRDPMTGHGITDAFRDAELLADCAARRPARPGLRACGAPSYERQRDAALADVFAPHPRPRRLPRPDPLRRAPDRAQRGPRP